jgi:hypothetical protein
MSLGVKLGDLVGDTFYSLDRTNRGTAELLHY